MLLDSAGTDALVRYYESYAALSARTGVSLMLDTPTWRCNPDWTAKHNCNASDVKASIEKSVSMLLSIRDKFETSENEIISCGCVGPRRDGYVTLR